MIRIEKDYNKGKKVSIDKLIENDLLCWEDLIACQEGSLIDSFIFWNEGNQLSIKEKYIVVLERYENPWSSIHWMFGTNNESWVEEFTEIALDNE